jgi:hypothetical protein
MHRRDTVPPAHHGKNVHRHRLLVLAAILSGALGIPAARADNIVTDWNADFLTIVQQTSASWVDGPPEVAREMAILGNAMSDAVNAATGGTIGYYAYAGGAMAGTDASVAAAAAAYTALDNIFANAAWQTPLSTPTGPTNNSLIPASTLANTIVLPELRTFLTTTLGFDPSTICTDPTSTNCASYNLGVSAANAVTAKQSNDGAIAAIQTGLQTNKPTGSGTTPGVYVPPASRPEMLPTWGSVTPTAITGSQVTAAQATVSGPPPLSGTAYATALLQTECEGSSTALPADIAATCLQAGFAPETQAQATAALFWNDPGSTSQPPGHWLQIADSVMQSQNSSLLQSAQLTALLGDAENDAGIAAWGIKYTNNLWRPVTAITSDCSVGGDGASTTRTSSWSTSFTTCDPGWTSLIATPPHPDYIAGHPAFSGAAATVLTDFYQTDNIGFASTSNYYCNGGVTNYDPDSGLVASCQASSGTVYYVSDPITGQPDCNTITTTGINNHSLLICPITETYDDFSDASAGPLGAEYSRVVGGIHTPFSVEDALTVGDAIGTYVAADASLPNDVPEPSGLAIAVIGLLPLAGPRRRHRPGLKPHNA